ncbi:MAG TPA: MoaD family protein [Acidimicrobiales bacterium]|nr:MoaD family protein [Acidimicrobiales bacterium]
MGEVAPESIREERAPAGVTLLFFAAARQAAGVAKESVDAATLAEVLDGARRRHGEAFTAILEGCRVWVNGEPAEEATALRDGDEVAVLPPVSGGYG